MIIWVYLWQGMGVIKEFSFVAQQELEEHCLLPLEVKPTKAKIVVLGGC